MTEQTFMDAFGQQALDVWSDPSRRKVGEQSTADKVKTAIMAAINKPTAAVSGLDPNTLALWADYSHWNGELDLTKTQPWLKGAIFKLCDGKQMYAGNSLDLNNYKDKTASANVQKAYDIGIPCGLYHYLHFTLDYGWTLQSVIDWQLKVIKAALGSLIPGKSFHLFALDVEEPKGTSDVNAQKVLQGIYAGLREMLGDDFPIVFYSSNGVLNQIPAVRDWLSFQGSDKQLWLAQWPFSGRQVITWENLYAQKISTLNMKVVTPGFADWRMVQWSACFVVPGCTVNYTDLNFYHGTVADCDRWLGYTKRGNPPTTPDPKPDPIPADIKERLEVLEAGQAANVARLDRLEAQAVTGVEVTVRKGVG